MKPIFLEPIEKKLIWGTEQWVISAHKNGDCNILGDKHTLSSLWKNHPEYFGRTDSFGVFPLLTKIIDAHEDLSIQVHPDDDYAFKNENGSLGKTECWYILDAKPDATIVIGHNAKSTEEVKSMISNHQWSDFIREIPVKKGDFLFIEPGTVHAIKGGTLILETQQSSDITYRVYDYDRLQNGKLRQLHVKQSIDVITAPYVEKKPPVKMDKTLNKNLNQLVSCSKFTVWYVKVDERLEIVQDQSFMIVSVIGGEGTINGIQIKKDDSFILPFKFGIAAFEGKMELIISCE